VESLTLSVLNAWSGLIHRVVLLLARGVPMLRDAAAAMWSLSSLAGVNPFMLGAGYNAQNSRSTVFLKP